jgi:hypothetical protein
MLAALWLLLAPALLVGAGYSHYRYRVKNNRYYARLFSTDPVERARATEPRFSPYLLPATALILVCVLAPVSLAI